MTQKLVDPDRHLVAEGRRYGVLTVCAASHRDLGAALSEIGHPGQRLADQTEENLVCLAQQQQISRLRNVLGRCAPMDPAAMWLPDHAGKLPNQRHERMSGALEPLLDARAVQQVEACRRGDGLGRFAWNDFELCLRVGQRRLDVEPSLPAVLACIDGPYAWILDPCGRRKGVAHLSSLAITNCVRLAIDTQALEPRPVEVNAVPGTIGCGRASIGELERMGDIAIEAEAVRLEIAAVWTSRQ